MAGWDLSLLLTGLAVLHSLLAGTFVIRFSLSWLPAYYSCWCMLKLLCHLFAAVAAKNSRFCLRYHRRRYLQGPVTE